MDLFFEVHKLAKFSANPSKVHNEGLLHLLSYNRNNKTLGLNYYANINDTPVSEILRQDSIDNDYMILVIKIVQPMSEVQENISSFIKVVQFTMSHMLQYQLLNKVHKVSTMQHLLQ